MAMTGFMNDGELEDALSALDKARQPTVLVVDDISDNLELIVDIFEEEPWTVVTAQNARTAWDIVKQDPPDLVLLDIQMPDVDGHELCRAMKQHPFAAEIPVIFLTAERLSSGDVVAGLELGADDYICKPFDKAELCARVRNALRRHSVGT